MLEVVRDADRSREAGPARHVWVPRVEGLARGLRAGRALILRPETRVDEALAAALQQLR